MPSKMSFSQTGVFFYLVFSIHCFFGSICDDVTDDPGETSDSDMTEAIHGEALFLTPYLESGKLPEARQLSLIKDLPDTDETSPMYSGFITVNKLYNSSMFFWFVTAANGNKEAPLLLWLQGGPGESSLMGLFVEHGPYFLNADLTTGVREYAWTKLYHVLYVDNPVGAGFSFTDDEKGYVQNQDEMADNMFVLLQQFFLLFPEYISNEFYIMGESYGGKYVPSVAYKIHTEGKNSSTINFKGMAIGNGISDPESMLYLSDYYYQHGLIDRNEAVVVRQACDSISQHIQKEEYFEATTEMGTLMDLFARLPQNDTILRRYTGYSFFYNYLFTEEPDNYRYYFPYVDKPKVRKALHVGDQKFQDGTMVQKHLFLDIPKSVKPKVEEIMNNYRVMYYSGQLDLCIVYPMTENFLHSVKWKSEQEYKESQKIIWKLEDSDDIAGYVRNVEDYFYEVLVRNAGHLVPHDQSKVALDLITRFLNRQPFN